MSNSDFYKSIGICIVCRKRAAEPNKTECIECAERSRIRQERKRKSLTEDEKKSLNKKIRESHKRLYEERKKNGLCTKCGRKAQYGNRLCIECYVKTIQKSKKVGLARSERPSYGLCYFCGERSLHGMGVCAKCYDRVEKAREAKRNGQKSGNIEK